MASAATPDVGLYTRTIISSPVIRWTLIAAIQHEELPDVVFIGETHVAIHRLREDGQLECISRHDSFGARICAAGSISNNVPRTGGGLDALIKQGSFPIGNQIYGNSSEIPPQSIVLTLDDNRLISFFLRHEEDGAIAFVTQTVPLPRFGGRLAQVGEHLAVDPRSLALATAAHEGELVICPVSEDLQSIDAMQIDGSESRRTLGVGQPQRVEGAVQHLTFLNAPNGADDGHVFLLIIVIDKNARFRAVVLDWRSEDSLSGIQAHKGLVLDAFRTTSSLLIPLRDAVFALIVGNEIRIWKGILSGSSVCSVEVLPAVPPAYPGNSSLAPRWTAYARSRSSPTAAPGSALFYLLREDGTVVAVRFDPQLNPASVHIGNVGCHSSSAFACYSAPGEPDLLFIGGDMSDGRVVSVERWALESLFDQFASADSEEDLSVAMSLKMILPSWASMTDSLVRNGHRLFVTSGRQPFGSVTELRSGIQVRLHGYFEMAGLRSTTGIWALPDVPSTDLIIFLSGPDETRILRASAAFDAIEEIEDSTSFDTSGRTLFAGVTISGHVVQINLQGMHIHFRSPPFLADLVHWRYECEEQAVILAASILPHDNAIITAEGTETGFSLVLYKLSVLDNANDSVTRDEYIKRHILIESAIRPLTIATSELDSRSILIVASEDCTTSVFFVSRYDGHADWQPRIVATLPPFTTPSLCDHIVILQAAPSIGIPGRLMAMCGMRDGEVAAFEILSHGTPSLDQQHIFTLGPSSVKLVRSSTQTASVIALVDNESYRIKWSPDKPLRLTVECLWISDTSRPEYAQGPIIACAFGPPSIAEGDTEERVPSNPAVEPLIMLSGDEFLVGAMDAAVSIAPRRIALTGTPNRLIYAEKQRCLVCASLRTGVRNFPSPSPHSPPVEKRQIWPIIDFIPNKSETASSYTYHMQPGERIYSLLEWSFQHEADKIYSFILSAGSYTKPDGLTIKGRVRFLQPINKNWEVTDVKEGHSIKFESPVYALASYDRITFIAASGRYLYMYRFSIAEKRWDQICPRFTLGSAAHFVSVEDDIVTDALPARKVICVSTTQDSLVTLYLDEVNREGADGAACSYGYILLPLSAGPQAHSNLTHVKVLDAAHKGAGRDHLIITASRLGQIFGLQCPSLSHVTTDHSTTYNNDPSHRHPSTYIIRSSKIAFTANLPRSLTRIRATTPAINRLGTSSALDHGILFPQQSFLTGISADGSVTRLVLLPADLCHRLLWLQQLCAWAADGSPTPHPSSAISSPSPFPLSPPSTQPHHPFSTRPPSIPIGLSRRASPTDSPALTTATRHHPHFHPARDADMHVTGDLLAHFLAHPRAEDLLRTCISDLARGDDPTAVWLRAHLDDELAAVGEMLALARALEYFVS